MTSLERFYAAIHHEEVDVMPCVLPNFAIGAKNSGQPFDQYFLDDHCMARMNIDMWEEFHPDVLMIENGTAALAQAMGCGVTMRTQEVPTVTAPAILTLDESDERMIDESLLKAPLVQSNLRTVARLKERFKDSLAIIGCGDQGPFSLAAQVYGMENLLMDLMDEECYSQIEKLMEQCVRAEVIYCKALLRAGAHCVSIGDSTAGPDVISPAFYKKFGQKYERMFMDEMHRIGAIAALHICGNATPIIGDMIDTGADILEIDQKTNLNEVYFAIKDKVTILGQISPITLMNASPSEVTCETQEMLKIVGGANATGVILAPGCTLGASTPSENIHAMLSCLR